MKILHLTESRNISSIKRYGLLPSKVKLEHHLSTFKESGLRGNKVLYGWLDSEKNKKFSRDMIYCKQWIDKRNEICGPYETQEECFDFSKDKTQYFCEKSYTLLLVEVSRKQIIDGDFIHEQIQSDSKYNSLFQMDSRFEHDDKILILVKVKIKWNFITKICEYKTYIDKAKKLRIGVLS